MLVHRQDIISGEVARPTLRRLRNAQLLVHQAMKVDKTSGVFTAGAWLTWAGAPKMAQKYAERALRVNPEHALASEVLFLAKTRSDPAWPRPR